jgi:tetratricopeptide (TPR) repeat protein
MTMPRYGVCQCVYLSLVAVAFGACATRYRVSGSECSRPDAQLTRWVQELDAQQALGCPDAPGSGATSCAGLRLSIERQSMLCPAHGPTKMVSAVLAYDAGETAKAQQFLDAIFERPHSDPDAAILRARIAIDDGNLRFAQRFVMEQIRLAPDHAGLREMHAGTLFLSHELEAAQHELVAAKNLGAPAWRVAYHLGLIEESLAQPELARQRYAEALQGNPDFAPARSRLNALGGPPR